MFFGLQKTRYQDVLDEPFVAIGNDQLVGHIEEGDLVPCAVCTGEHQVKCSLLDNGAKGSLLFYTCKNKSYLAGIDGKHITY